MPSVPPVSVITVSYNTKDLLRQALQCLEGATGVHEVIVVDNASQDGSADMVESEFPNVRLIRNDKNRGFGAANNQGLDIMTGQVALLLNSDARPTPNAILTLARTFADHPNTVACGGRLQFPDGRLQQSACNPLTLWAVYCEQSYLEKLFPNSTLFSPYWISERLIKKGPGPYKVAQVMGACLMMRPVERFDERFFLYCEDTELCHRLQTHGDIYYVPQAVFEHDLGASSATTRWQAVARYNRGKELYFQIHHGKFKAALCWWSNRKGAAFRLILYIFGFIASAGTRFKDKIALFWKVMTAPVSGPPRPADSD